MTREPRAVTADGEPSLRVLITNLYVRGFSGSETVVEMVADGLRRAGHQPFIYAPTLGPQAQRMRSRGHLVVDRLAALPERPDVIHAQHCTPTMMALAALPNVPALYLCHGPYMELESPPLHPQIRRYAAVSELVRQRCLERGVPQGRLSILPNAVDLTRYRPRPPLPPRPSRALLLAKASDHRSAVATACAAAGLPLDELGRASRRVSPNLENELPAYDIVFANGRSALEAAVVGCAVVVCEATGLAGLITSDNLDRFRLFNFAIGVQVHPITADSVGAAIAAYDAADAARVSRRLRTEAGIEGCVTRLVALYREALSDPPPPFDETTAAAMAALLEEALPSAAERRWRRLVEELAGTPEVELEASMQRAHAQLRSELAALKVQLLALGATAGDALQASLAALQRIESAAEATAGRRMERLVRGLYRSAVPLAVRRPLHALRRQLSDAGRGDR